jgi:hypothetical protein
MCVQYRGCVLASEFHFAQSVTGVKMAFLATAGTLIRPSHLYECLVIILIHSPVNVTKWQFNLIHAEIQEALRQQNISDLSCSINT